MMRRKSLGQGTSAEEKLARTIRARRRLKQIIRLAYANYYWLEDYTDVKLGDNVALNIRLLTIKSRKKSKLTLEHKMILKTQKHQRTEEEKKKLHRVLVGLKCFRRYPDEVQKKLAEVAYFEYIPPKRTVIRQGDDARALFFVLSGEVLVYQSTFDEILNEVVTNEVGKRGAGVMFGEVALLHGVKRTGTIVTSDHSEFLVIYKQDFDAVLKSSVMAEWEEIKKCMFKFTYFQNWDNIAVRDCTILSKVKKFDHDDVILSEDLGDKKYVYFLVNGQCDLIEHLNIEEIQYENKTTYRLLQGNDGSMSEDLTIKEGMVTISTILERTISTVRPRLTEDDRTISTMLRDKAEESGLSATSVRSIYPRRTKKTIFVRVAKFHSLATFNIGEKLERRIIIAKRRCLFLLIPRYWLIQKNREIWKNIRYFLDQQIPDTRKIFNEFVQQKKWEEYKKDLVQKILLQSKKVNSNNIHNVPYSIRIRETFSSSI